MTAFLYHFHGLGKYDFSSMSPEDLESLQQLAAARDVEILPTVYLRREALPALRELVQRYGVLAAEGAVPNIAGFAIEGPLLGPDGGIPRRGRWYPTADEWTQIADLGPHGLRYVVMAPDGAALDEVLDDGMTFADLLDRCYDNGVRIAIGHFHRNDPERSARRVDEVLDYLHSRYESSPNLVLTDHLYNDMPRNFVHAWRTEVARTRRPEQLAAVVGPTWTRHNIGELLGPVPAAVLNAALDGRLMPCLNFDGRHVDLAISRRTVDFLGCERLIALTDHTEVNVMAGEVLSQDSYSRLRLRDDGAVAAGSSGYEQQRENMLSIGMAHDQIDQIFYRNPKAAIDFRPKRQTATV
ncbi:hypothetical protein GCM10027290_01790 [Micromonospora sonneratiae]|uniref:Amidohydrolase n=1 Tax=Micromonospora sonneratiae TaxID=1184706 RepID=A0ABW3Y7Q2_9ACTN